MQNSESRKRVAAGASEDRVERIARHIAARIYRSSWDHLPKGDRRAARALALLAIEDVAAGDAEVPR